MPPPRGCLSLRIGLSPLYTQPGRYSVFDITAVLMVCPVVGLRGSEEGTKARRKFALPSRSRHSVSSFKTGSPGVVQRKVCSVFTEAQGSRAEARRSCARRRFWGRRWEHGARGGKRFHGSRRRNQLSGRRTGHGRSCLRGEEGFPPGRR